jgi:hypothetical protein
MNKKNLIISALVIIILGSLIFGVIYSSQNTDESSNTDETTENTSNNEESDDSINISESDGDTTNPLSEFVGVYAGQGALFSGAFQFPDTTFTLDDAGRFSLVADGLDLIVTQNQTLSVDGNYPITSVNAMGSTELQGDGSVAMNVETFEINFTIAGQPVDEATKAGILAGLESSFGVVLPEVSVAEPLVIETQLSATQDGELDISNKTGVQDQIYVSFNGQKE